MHSAPRAARVATLALIAVMSFGAVPDVSLAAHASSGLAPAISSDTDRRERAPRRQARAPHPRAQSDTGRAARRAARTHQAATTLLAESQPASETTWETGYDGLQDFERWKVTDGYDLDRYVFRSGGPIEFSIRLKKYLGPVDAAGHPVEGHVLFGATVAFDITAWDVDVRCTDPCESGFVPEVDEVDLNGTLVGTLDGLDGASATTTFDVQASLLRFKSSYADEAGGWNDIRVFVDQESGFDRWGVTVEKASIDLPVAPERFRPTVVIPGLTGNPAGVEDVFDEFVAGEVPAEAILTPAYDSFSRIAVTLGEMAPS